MFERLDEVGIDISNHVGAFMSKADLGVRMHGTYLCTSISYCLPTFTHTQAFPHKQTHTHTHAKKFSSYAEDPIIVGGSSTS